MKPLHGIVIMITIVMYNGIYLLLEGSSSNTMILLYFGTSLALFVNVLTHIVNFPHNNVVHEYDLFVHLNNAIECFFVSLLTPVTPVILSGFVPI